eukprot:c14141_g1_i1 orf=463-1728(+)
MCLGLIFPAWYWQPQSLWDSTNLAMHWLLQGSMFHYHSEGVPIVHAAVFLACIVPGALIALNQESLQLLSPVRALRIYCAGVWHNIMCCTGCYLLLMLFPVVLYPFYVWNQYPVVSNIGAGSPLAGHLNLGDSILKVAGHQLQSPEDWFEFLYNRSIQELAHFNHSSIAHGIVEESQKPYYRTALQGFCACSENFTNHQNRLLGSLCPDEALLFYQHPCISAMSSSVNTSQNIYCLKATDVIKCPACSLEEKSEATFHPCSCSESRSCLFPLLSHGEVFVDINVKKSSLKRCSVKLTDSSCEHSLVFVGNPRDLFHSLQLTNYWPRQEGLFGLFPLSFSVLFLKFLERLLMYTFSLSAAMVLLNSAPVFYLDGELVFQAWLVLSRSWSHPRKHKRIMQIVLTGGTLLMASFLIFEFIRTCF